MNRQIFAFECLLAVFGLVLAGVASCHCPNREGTLWRDAVVTELDVDFGAGFHARWRFTAVTAGIYR